MMNSIVIAVGILIRSTLLLGNIAFDYRHHE